MCKEETLSDKELTGYEWEEYCMHKEVDFEGDTMFWKEDVKYFIKELLNIEVYRDLVSKQEAWILEGDALCDLIEKRLRERIKQKAGDKLI